MNGKGDRNRTSNFNQYRNNYDCVFNNYNINYYIDFIDNCWYNELPVILPEDFIEL